jgi:hypothetical protein
MILPKKYLPINWTGSMKFSEAHFIENEQSIYDAIRDAISVLVNTYNYGVLPPFLGQSESIDIQINQRSDQFVQVAVNGLNAITASGMRIFINPKNEIESVSCTHSFVVADEDTGTGQVFDIVLRVIPEERVPVGEPDPDEMPPRIPYVRPKYLLSVLPTNQGSSDGAGHLVVGRIIQLRDQFLVDEHYIPPCTAVISHRALLQAYKNYGEILGSLQANALKVIAKIQLRNQHPGLSRTIEGLCRELLNYIADIQFEYQNMVRQQPPIVMIGYFSTLANKLLVLINCFNTIDKEELLNYFYQWIDVTPGGFGKVLTKCAGIMYQHQNINESIEPIYQFLDMLDTIWKRLATLEYIGQRRDNIVIAAEQTQTRNTASGGRQAWKTID